MPDCQVAARLCVQMPQTLMFLTSCHMQARAALARCQQDAALAAASKLGNAGEILGAHQQPVSVPVYGYVPAAAGCRGLLCHKDLSNEAAAT